MTKPSTMFVFQTFVFSSERSSSGRVRQEVLNLSLRPRVIFFSMSLSMEESLGTKDALSSLWHHSIKALQNTCGRSC